MGTHVHARLHLARAAAAFRFLPLSPCRSSSKLSQARPSPSRWKVPTPSRPSKPRYKTKKASPPTSSVSSSLANNLKMAALSRTITSKRNQPFTWCCVFVAAATKALLCVELTPQCSPPPTMGVSRRSWLHTPRTKERNRSSNLSTHYQFVAHARARHRSWYRQGKADHDFSAVTSSSSSVRGGDWDCGCCMWWGLLIHKS